MYCNHKFLPILMVSVSQIGYRLMSLFYHAKNHMYAHINTGDQPGLKREIGHKPIRGLCQRLKGEIFQLHFQDSKNNCLSTKHTGIPQHLPTQANKVGFVVT